MLYPHRDRFRRLVSSRPRQWFVAILQLYRPIQIAQEIWRSSNLHAPTGAG
jgi:hypothetical protein